MTKEEIIALVKECAAGLGRASTVPEFLGMKKVTRHQVQKHFGTHRRMLAASGFECEGSGYPISMRSPFSFLEHTHPATECDLIGCRR
jgi:hypothetical protein